jgi:hypothetical protein
MKKNYLLFSFFLVALFATLNVTQVNSHITSPPAGSSGDPVLNTTCAQSGCHAGPATNATANDLMLKIGVNSPTTTLNSSFVYAPGTQYNIAFLIQATATTNPYYGFQIVALTSSNTQAGTMTAVSLATTQINTASGLQYMGHHSASATRNWSFKWTAPVAGSGPVTFYYAFNVANASVVPPTTPQGTVYKGSVTIQQGPTGIADISDKISDLNIFPNPISKDFSISFDLKEASDISSQLYSLDGRLQKELINQKMSEGNFHQQFDVSDLPSGIYLVQLNVGESSITRKIIKQ